ncbi:hypothetical protein GCM10007391_35100 [Alteromonas halophila]|uniref:Uncharacterized protein n=1 Tax=Alteromonas halophila TaxID=516698 RepID=A0A918JQN6_9ALTE|nr:hypothetical protein GCM10007391_35100 [Alteromonas halophila]
MDHLLTKRIDFDAVNAVPTQIVLFEKNAKGSASPKEVLRSNLLHAESSILR